MAEVQTALAGDTATVEVRENGTPEQRMAPVEIETRRKQAIRNLCAANGLDKRFEANWIAGGASLETVADEMIGIMQERAKDAPPAGIGLSKRETAQYSITRALRAALSKDWSKAGLELEAHKAVMSAHGVTSRSGTSFFVPMEIQARMAKRDMTVAGVSGSQYLVGTDNLAGSFIDLLRNRAVVAQLGATMMTGLVGNVTIPKQTAAATAYWLTNEATAITESQMTLGQLALSPKNVGAYTELSRQLMLQSSPAADALVMNDLARVLALAIDLAALEGSGASGQPTGISQTAGIGSVTGTSIDYAKVLEFQTDVAGGNALAANCAYVTTPAVASLLKQRVAFSSTASPLWEGGILDGNLQGFRAVATNSVTAASMVFGDFSQVVIGEWGMLELALNPYANFAAAISGIRAIQTVDIGIRQAGAFSRATSIT